MVQQKYIKWVFVGLGILFLLMLVVFIYQNSGSSAYRVVRTNLVDKQLTHVQLEGTKLRLFNGAAFYSVDLASSENNVTIHGSAKQRIPNPAAIIWAGDRGALMKFDRSFFYTEVFSVAREQGISVFDIDQTTWWYDFEADEFRFVSDKPIYNDVGVYDGEDSVYFVSAGSRAWLYKYDISSGKTTRVAKDTAFTDPRSMTQCESTICVLGISSRQPGTYSVWQYNADSDTLSPAYNSDAPIIPTGQKNVFFTYKGNTGAQTDGQIAAYSSGVIVDITTQTEQVFEYDFPLDSVGVHVVDGDGFAFIENREGVYTELVERLLGERLEDKELTIDGETYRLGVLSNYRSYQNGILFGSFDNEIMLFTNLSGLVAPEPATSDTVLPALNGCDLDVEYISQIDTYTITAKDSEVETVFTKAGECFEQNPQILYGNTYLYQTVSDFNGRVTSD